jgi:hypothetical protein
MSGKRDKAVRRQVDKHSVAFGGGAMNDAAQRSLTFRERTLSNPRFKHGIQNIVPAWNHDYTAQAKEAAQCQQ